MPKGQLSTLTREFWMPFTFQAALLALQQPHKHPHSLQLAIYIQLAHHFIQYALWAFLLLNHLWGKNHCPCSRFFNTILNTLLRLCQTVIGRWGSMSLVLQLWSWWLAFHSTKSSLCFFLQISLASCYPFLLASFPGIVSYLEGLSGLRCLGSDMYNYLQDVLWDLMDYPHSKLTALNAFTDDTPPQSTLVIADGDHLPLG